MEGALDDPDRDPDMDSRIYLRIIHHLEAGTNMTSTCGVTKTSIMTSRVRHSERGSVISDCIFIRNVDGALRQQATVDAFLSCADVPVSRFEFTFKSSV